MFHRLDIFDGPIFGVGGEAYIWGLIFGMLIGFHILGAYFRGGGYIRGRINGILRYFDNLQHPWTVWRQMKVFKTSQKETNKRVSRKSILKPLAD